jgi:membrane carboxypeptidase/penicillin-binding protein
MGIVRVENSKGAVLWSPQPVRAPVMSQEEAWLMVSMMKDVVQRGTAAGSVGALFHVPSGGKTGTTNDGNDVWYIGYTPDLLAGVWMGLDKPQKIKANAQGGVLAAPAWTAFMTEVYRRKPAPPDWPRPEGITTRQVDAATGQLASVSCAGDPVYTEFYVAGTEPTQMCQRALGTDTTGALMPAPFPDTGLRRSVPTGPLSGTGALVVPGAAPIPRAAARADTTRLPRDSAARPKTKPDTTNPFYLPPPKPIKP